MATITTGVKDKTGTALATDKVWAFTTAILADTTPPTVTIDSKPAAITNNQKPIFGFSANEPNSTYECSLSSGTNPDVFTPCASPKTYGPLAEGTYTFKVKATDSAGNIGQAASYSFKVDITAPTITDLAPAPGSSTSNRRPTIAATVTDTQTNLNTSDITFFLDGNKQGKFSYDRNSDRLTFEPNSNLTFGTHTVESAPKTRRATRRAGAGASQWCAREPAREHSRGGRVTTSSIPSLA